MTERDLELKDLRITGIENDVTYYKGYIYNYQIMGFVVENKLNVVTNKDIDVGAFYCDIENARVFCFYKPYSELTTIYVVPYPNPYEDDKESDDRIAIVDHLMEMVKMMNKYYEMMRVY